ncbi:hypothetical protein GIB67_009354 [Kingdonia uniflora]|uniref:Uncharacterized protein n=1 Tax=Kingdonia uniflora TaxID=39325 RepID=A0A7J7N2U7_9MAGN|nr:hypothetical protein GIB67_009354 [Kingdonia uniflora]
MEDQKELQLFSTFSSSGTLSEWKSDSTGVPKPKLSNHFEKSSVDLQLSISLQPRSDYVLTMEGGNRFDMKCVKTLKWQAAEQSRVAAAEKEYAEKIRALSKREMELAQWEFARARHMWERAKEEVDKAERLKARITRHRTDSSECMEITCQACNQQFKP